MSDPVEETQRDTTTSDQPADDSAEPQKEAEPGPERDPADDTSSASATLSELHP